MHGWILRHVPSQIFAAGLLRKFRSSGSYHKAALLGYDELPVTQCTIFQRPLHEACPLLLRRKVSSITGWKAIQASRTSGYPSSFPFTGSRHAHRGTPFHTAARHLTAPKPGEELEGEMLEFEASPYVLGSMLEFTQIIILIHEEPCQVGTFFLFYQKKKKRES